jgi:outer membrane protein TolC
VVTLRVSFPFKNNTARGRLLQSEAILSQSGIQRRDLERVIDSNITDLLGELRGALGEITALRLSASFYEETMQGVSERFRRGEASLIDTILTEERLTFAMVDLVRAQQTYCSLLARLRFEAGILLEHQDLPEETSATRSPRSAGLTSP